MNLFTKQEETQTKNKLMVTKGERGWVEGGINYEDESNIKLPNIKQKNNKNLWYRTGNCIQHFVIITYKGKES